MQGDSQDYVTAMELYMSVIVTYINTFMLQLKKMNSVFCWSIRTHFLTVYMAVKVCYQHISLILLHESLAWPAASHQSEPGTRGVSPQCLLVSEDSGFVPQAPDMTWLYWRYSWERLQHTNAKGQRRRKGSEWI